MNKKKLSNEGIQVFVRCRPLLKSEMNHPVPVEVYPEVNKILVRETGTDKSCVKSFTFDKVFGSEAKQEDIYYSVVAPVVQEVIRGFNCTIFAYGQTGTGKTFTIEGGRSPNLEDRSEDPLAGIIPRSMCHLFKDLSKQKLKYEICVSFLELYNEEIFDLLSKTDDPVKLRLFDNSSQKGSVIVQGLQIVPVTSMAEVYMILDKGFRKRRKAATLLNKASSRSHTIFTVTLNIKESSTTLEKLKSGKLNLVDLAGSENIGRSGAIDKRAREAGNINQSLLALGRVITALCEKASHVPYRESKLTRLLQDSLGGQTKTTIIATISPSTVHSDETLNTLEYALRAKSITNKPEVNTQVTANCMMKDYLEKIYQMEKQLYGLRGTHEIYVSEETFRNMKSALDSKKEEKFKILFEMEKAIEENKALDAAILEANNKLAEKKKRLEAAKIERDVNRAVLEKEKKEQKLYEAMLQVIQPIHENLHKQLHKDLDEIQKLESESAKIKQTVKKTIKDQRELYENLEYIREKRKLWKENFQRNSDSVMNDMRSMNENVHSLTSECNNWLSVLKNGLDERISDCEKEFESIFKVLTDLEEINNSFKRNSETSLYDEKSTELKWIEESYKACSDSNATAELKKLSNGLIDCEASLLSISSALNDWNRSLASKVDARQKRVQQCLENQSSTLESITDYVKASLNKQKENIDLYNNIILESVNLDAANRQLWTDKFLAVEKALSSLDVHCTEFINNEIDKVSKANSSLQNCSKFGTEIAEKLSAYCENSVKNIDGMQKEVDSHVQNVFSGKWEDVETKVDDSCSNYKDLNSEIEKLHNKPQSVNWRGTGIVEDLKNKLKANEESKVSANLKMVSDSTLKRVEKYKKDLVENQTKVEESLSKDKMHSEKLAGLSKELSNTLNSGVSSYIQCFQTDLLESLTKDTKMDEKITEEANFENTVLNMDNTMISSNCSEKYGCVVCTSESKGQALRLGDDTLTSMLISEGSLKITQGPPQETGDALGSNSCTAAVSQSPVRHSIKRSAVKSRRNLLFPKVEKLQELLEDSSEEEKS